MANQAIHTVEMENLSGNPIQDLHSLMKHFRCEKKRIQILIDEQKASGTGDEEIIAALEDELGVTVSEAQCYVDEVRTFLTPEQRDFLKSEIPLFVDFPG